MILPLCNFFLTIMPLNISTTVKWDGGRKKNLNASDNGSDCFQLLLRSTEISRETEDIDGICKFLAFTICPQVVVAIPIYILSTAEQEADPDCLPYVARPAVAALSSCERRTPRTHRRPQWTPRIRSLSASSAIQISN